MRSKKLFRVHPEKYKQLLAVLIFIFAISPFSNHILGEIICALLLLYAIISILQTIELPRSLLYAYLGIALSAF
ncbi:MAG: two pore domain potassium channel family protein, partial [Cyanobacteria bacterium P01_D01_bin.73]